MGAVSSVLPIVVIYLALIGITIGVIVSKWRTNQSLVMVVVAVAIILAGILFFGLPAQTDPPKAGASSSSSPPQQLSAVGKVVPDPFTFNPGPNSATDASSFVGEQNCIVKSQNTLWSSDLRRCQCKTGYFGPLCEYSSYNNSYVTLTTGSRIIAGYGSQLSTDSLTQWPGTASTSGCTNECTLQSNCIGVEYHQGLCVPITSLTFTGAPIHDTSTIESSNTFYLNKDRLNQIKMSGYYNVIFGILPPRYFVGNIISGLTGQNYYTTDTGAKILYFVIGADNSFVGIPDYIIVNSLGNLYISTSPIPDPLPVGGLAGLIVILSTPITVTKQIFLNNFGRATSSTSFHIRYVQS